MEKILFITNRDVLTTCGALRLIKNRAEILYSEYHIATDFCVFQKSSRIASAKRETIEAGGKMQIVGYSLINFFLAYYRFLRLISTTLMSDHYKAIVISQTAFPINIEWIKNYSSVPIFLDGHGASEDIYESARGGSSLSFVLRYFAYRIDIVLIKYYLKRVDGCFVVSNGMKQYYNNLTSNKSIHYVAAPCSTTAIDNNFDYISIRNDYRKRFGVNKEDICFVYSGGIEPWQCVEETISLFKKTSEQLPYPCRMFIFTYETEKVKHMVSDDKRFVVASFKADELRKALCAMDYSFLIRKDTITNHVAFPNKYLEYVQARLKVISTPFVYDVAEQISLFDCGFICKTARSSGELAGFIKKDACRHISREKSVEIVEYSSFKNRLKSFVDYLN